MSIGRREFLLGAAALVVARRTRVSWAEASPPSPPVGTVLEYAGQVPDGWVLCDGRKLSRVRYRVLYETVGEKFGRAGRGQFRVPDLRGRTLNGRDPLRGGDGRWRLTGFVIKAR